MASADLPPQRRLASEFRSLLARVQAARHGLDDAVRACVASVPPGSSERDFQWPKGFIINVGCPLDAAERVAADGRPCRWLRLAGRTRAKTAIIVVAQEAGRLLASCPADVVHEAATESTACRNAYRWILTVFDLALANLEGSGLRVEGHDQGGRFFRTGASWDAAVVPVREASDGRPWFATIGNLWVASEFAIHELVSRLERADRDGKDTTAPTAPTAPPLVNVPVTVLENVRMNWKAFCTRKRNRISGSLYEAFDHEHGYPAGTTKRAVNALKCRVQRRSKKIKAARPRHGT